MVGEIRDGETAEIALQAAQTGHMVLSTLHTNDSISAIARLVDLNVPSFLIASSVSAVLAQRLVRKLCTCKKSVPASMEYATRLLEHGIADIGSTMYVPGGCAQCDQTGYKGRIGIYELLILNEDIRSQIRSGERDDHIRRTACAHGMQLMQQDAVDKMRAGVTTLDEVLRVVPFEHHAQGRVCARCQKLLSPGFVFCPFCGVPVADAIGRSQMMQVMGRGSA